MLAIISVPAALLINAGLLIASLALALIMLNAGTQWSLNTGNSAEQAKYKWVVLRVLILLVLIGLTASIMNLFLISP